MTDSGITYKIEKLKRDAANLERILADRIAEFNQTGSLAAKFDVDTFTAELNAVNAEIAALEKKLADNTSYSIKQEDPPADPTNTIDPQELGTETENWEVRKDTPDEQNVLVGEGETPEAAVTDAIQNGMPASEAPELLASAQKQVDEAQAAAAAAAVAAQGQEPNDEETGSPYKGLQGGVANTRKQASAQDLYNFKQQKDWRVRLTLAPSANYLYNANPPGILAPLKLTDGVVFPYTPQIQVGYTANYDATEVTHSNYKIYQYRSSGIDSVSITGNFTAQDTYEANYLLAVIHFFRSVTKMFYGKDENPVNGTPPPLCYLFGYGEYQFNAHPLAITNFSYSLPDDVDYIRATASFDYNISSDSNSGGRAESSGLGPGGSPPPPKFNGLSVTGDGEKTYVPTRMQIQIQAIPIISRKTISENFSLKDYANGSLLRGSKSAYRGVW